ncbi:hypothetical protein EV361DRAFT_284159 [Lentinula raphanica]|nr:hypothetical protein EV361DRAFT_284159 [Lentinula raphanica]
MEFRFSKARAYIIVIMFILCRLTFAILSPYDSRVEDSIACSHITYLNPVQTPYEWIWGRQIRWCWPLYDIRRRA